MSRLRAWHALMFVSLLACGVGPDVYLDEPEPQGLQASNPPEPDAGSAAGAGGQASAGAGGGASTGCAADADCTGRGEDASRCDVSRGVCVACLVDGDCVGIEHTHCEPMAHECVECLDDTHCLIGTHCDLDGFECKDEEEEEAEGL